MGDTVKTYRVLRDGMRVGDSVRDFGDYMPEAEEMDTLRTLLNANVIEVVYVDPQAIKDWEKAQAKKDRQRIEEEQRALSGEVTEDEEDEDEATPRPKVKKRVAKKTVAKKSIKKKGKTSGLAEQSV